MPTNYTPPPDEVHPYFNDFPKVWQQLQYWLDYGVGNIWLIPDENSNKMLQFTRESAYGLAPIVADDVQTTDYYYVWDYAMDQFNRVISGNVKLQGVQRVPRQRGNY